MPVQITANPASPRDRNFFLNLTGSTLSNIVRAQGAVTIIDNAKVPDISVGDATAAAQAFGPGTETFTVFLSGTSNQDVTFTYATADGTAQSGVDYLGTNGPQIGVITAGQTSTTITVPILQNASLQNNINFA